MGQLRGQFHVPDGAIPYGPMEYIVAIADGWAKVWAVPNVDGWAGGCYGCNDLAGVEGLDSRQEVKGDREQGWRSRSTLEGLLGSKDSVLRWAEDMNLESVKGSALRVMSLKRILGNTLEVKSAKEWTGGSNGNRWFKGIPTKWDSGTESSWEVPSRFKLENTGWFYRVYIRYEISAQTRLETVINGSTDADGV